LIQIETLNQGIEDAAEAPLRLQVTFLPNIGSGVPGAKDTLAIAADQSQYHGSYDSLFSGGRQ
jgi:hypothetical protein